MNVKGSNEPVIAPNGQWQGFGSKVLLSAFGILFTALVLYFGWLGNAIVQIRVDAAEVKRDVKSLLETRQRDEAASITESSKRLDELERDSR